MPEHNKTTYGGSIKSRGLGPYRRRPTNQTNGEQKSEERTLFCFVSFLHPPPTLADCLLLSVPDLRLLCSTQREKGGGGGFGLESSRYLSACLSDHPSARPRSLTAAQSPKQRSPPPANKCAQLTIREHIIQTYCAVSVVRLSALALSCAFFFPPTPPLPASLLSYSVHTPSNLLPCLLSFEELI